MLAKSGAISPRKSTTLPTLEKPIWKINLDDPLCFWQGVREILWEMVTEGGRERLIVVDLKVFPTGVAEEIKAWLMQVTSQYSLTSVVLETYQAYDLYAWCKQRGLPAKLEHATREAQLAAFPVLIMAFEQGKIVIPRHELLIEELVALERTNGGKFRAGQGKHDDTVFALLWAVYEAVKFSPSKADITII
jgi:hypothetical protein